MGSEMCIRDSDGTPWRPVIHVRDVVSALVANSDIPETAVVAVGVDKLPGPNIFTILLSLARIKPPILFIFPFTANSPTSGRSDALGVESCVTLFFNLICIAVT